MSRRRVILQSVNLLVQTCTGVERSSRINGSCYLWPYKQVPVIISSSSSSQPFTVKKFFSVSSTTNAASKMMRRFIGMATAALPPSISLSVSPTPPEENGNDNEETYENAIRTLNTLQSNAATLAKVRENRAIRRSSSVPQTIACILQSGLTLEAIDNLDIVHVAGTKGKGMACAFTESILRQAGLKTGFFSSPHLTAVRERIRINGQPLSKEKFAKTFFTVYRKLEHLKNEQDDHCCEMPHYFRFLTVMAFHVFLEEQVDAVILEVGVGGLHDTTNFIKKPVVVGITSLGMEHQHVLGHTLGEIALQKAGIMKPGVPAYTVHTHPPEIQDILRERAKDVDCPLTVVEPMDLTGVELGVHDGDGGVVAVNAGLAIYLANELLLIKHSHIFPRLTGMVPSAVELQYSKDPTVFLPFQQRGLQLIKWDGRFQNLRDPLNKKITYFLDGAHTVDSLNVTLQWFNRQSSSARSLRLLVFNITGQRNPADLIAPLVNKDIFDLAIFCPMIAFTKNATSSASDNWSCLESEQKDILAGCRDIAKIWEEIQHRSKGVVLSSAEQTLEYIRELAVGEQYRVSVLITGSLHLVGNFLTVLQPNRNDDDE